MHEFIVFFYSTFFPTDHPYILLLINCHPEIPVPEFGSDQWQHTAYKLTDSRILNSNNLVIGIILDDISIATEIQDQCIRNFVFALTEKSILLSTTSRGDPDRIAIITPKPRSNISHGRFPSVRRLFLVELVKIDKIIYSLGAIPRTTRKRFWGANDCS